MSTIGNKKVKGIANEVIGFINVKGYTDIKSYAVIYLSGDMGFAIEVEKIIKPTGYMKGGFAGHYPNLQSDFDKAEPQRKKDVNQIELKWRNGVYGYMQNIIISTIPAGQSDAIDNISEWEAIYDNKGNIDSYVLYSKTKKGKIQKQFIKLGIIEPVCRYFYDYNF